MLQPSKFHRNVVGHPLRLTRIKNVSQKTKQTVIVTKIGEERWQDYRDLRLEALKLEPLAYSSSYEEEQNIPEAMWRDRIKNALFAVADNKPVGMAGIFCNNRFKTNHVCEIFGVYVRQDYRNKGIGKRLIEAALAEIQNLKGITKIKIGVNPTQKAAEHLYRKYGFKTVGRFKKDMRVDGKFYDELYMEKQL
ncbi:MAG: GNAT family N-acetyltransferase [Dehalococcoidales bacterium]